MYMYQIREQSAHMDKYDRVIIKIKMDDGTIKYLKAKRCWPDTRDAPAGDGFYIETSLEDVLPSR